MLFFEQFACWAVKGQTLLQIKLHFLIEVQPLTCNVFHSQDRIFIIENNVKECQCPFLLVLF